MPVSAADTKKVDILIVDDKLANICSLQAILSDPDYNLVTASSGAEALKHILQTDFAVILLDVMMPEMDGFEVARLVRQRGRNAAIPIIFLTAIATEFRFMQKGYSVGAVDYLQKPLDPDVVKAKVAVFVELYRRSERIREQEALLRELQRSEQERRLDAQRQESERHFRRLAESLPQIVATADEAGRIRYINLRWTQLTGAAPGERLFDASFMLKVHPQDRLSLTAVWEDAREHAKAAAIETRLMDEPHGLYRWHLCQLQPELNQDNQLLSWLLTLSDIDQQKRRSEGQKLLAEASAQLASSLDFDACLTQLCEKITEHFSDVAICDLLRPGKSFRRLLRATAEGGTKDLLQPLLRALAEAQQFESAKTCGGLALLDGKAHLVHALEEQPEAFGLQLTKGLQSEPERSGSLISAPVFARGELAGALTLLRSGKLDSFTSVELSQLTELARLISGSLENLLIYEEVRDSNRLKDEFLAILSHELRTPLNSILGWTELVKLEAVEPRVIEGLTVVERSAHTLTQLVNDLLDVSRIISGKLEISKQVVDVSGFLKNVVSALQPLADAKQVRLVLQEGSSLPKLDADPSRLEQIIWNLINNAIKFTPKGGEVRITTRTTPDRKIEIVVSDSGIGIRPELLPYIFERFRQADSSSTRRHGGLGLGLAIVKHLAALHDGTVTASSAGCGFGSTFTVTLPSSYMLPAPRPELGAEAFENFESALTHMRILLVDDDPSTRMLTARQLALSGAQVDAAASVAEAMRLVEQGLPDVVLTDIGMPEQDGFSLLRLLRRLEEQVGQNIKVAAFSAYASEDDARHALEQGFDVYLTKPISVGNLVQAVMKLKRTERLPLAGVDSAHYADNP